MLPSLKGSPGAGTIFAPSSPLVEQADVTIGRYLADPTLGRLYCVVDLRYVIREGRRVRIAMLEDAVTDEILPWEFARIAAFHRVDYVRVVDAAEPHI